MAGDALNLHISEKQRLSEEGPGLTRPRLQTERAHLRRNELRMQQQIAHLQGSAQEEVIRWLKRPDGESLNRKAQLRPNLLRHHLHGNIRPGPCDRDHHNMV
ncbi:hypothetical protein QYE76_040715 [Lolium multiflorum]|uniref:Uncharacterized protein n=1 Tax=Lolium multiflorum TaxID=4521 RepID=A0AAD8TDH4_LOLMU|nr:hypothetical protein QYE76_040715 [Lolium multiflorum]